MILHINEKGKCKNKELLNLFYYELTYIKSLQLSYSVSMLYKNVHTNTQ